MENEAKETLRQWILDTLSLISNKGDVTVEYSTDDQGVLFTAHVTPDNMGLVLGRKGAMVKTVRDILRVIGRRNSMVASLKVLAQE